MDDAGVVDFGLALFGVEVEGKGIAGSVDDVVSICEILQRSWRWRSRRGRLSCLEIGKVTGETRNVFWVGRGVVGCVETDDGGVDFGTGATEFDTCFGDCIADAGGASEDEFGGIVKFGGEFERQRGRGRDGYLGGADGSEGQAVVRREDGQWEALQSM